MDSHEARPPPGVRGRPHGVKDKGLLTTSYVPEGGGYRLRLTCKDNTSEKLPLRVDCIHRREFGEVSGHLVLIKRGPGNRGPTECGTTHEATSGMSS